MRKYSKNNFVFLFLVLMLISCVSSYDNITYQNLTYCKAEILTFLDSFSSQEIDITKADELSLNLRKILEYEKGKGEKNQITIKQFEILYNKINRYFVERKQKGRWTETYVRNVQDDIAEAFDIVISTENNKKY